MKQYCLSVGGTDLGYSLSFESDFMLDLKTKRISLELEWIDQGYSPMVNHPHRFGNGTSYTDIHGNVEMHWRQALLFDRYSPERIVN